MLNSVIIARIAERLIDRIAGSKKAKVTSAVGAVVGTGNLAINVGSQIYPNDPLIAALIDGTIYLFSIGLLAYREKKNL